MYSGQEAEKIRLKKEKAVKKYIDLVKNSQKAEENKTIIAYKKMIELTNECFGDLKPEEKEKHIMYNAFLGLDLSQEKNSFIFDEIDQKAEKILKKKINNIK